MANQEPEELRQKIEELARHHSPDFEEFDLNDIRLDEMWDEYSNEINFLIEKEPRMKSLTPSELIGWAKELRKVKKEKISKSKSFGVRERRVGPYTKKASPFKPKD